MLRESIARRYARALYDTVPAAERARAAEDLDRFAAATREVPELLHLLVNPNFTQAERDAGLAGVHEALGLAPTVRRLVGVLVENRRAGDVAAIAHAFRALSDEELGIVRGKVVGARALPDDAAPKLAAALGAAFGKKFQLDTAVDPTLLGGVQVRIGSVVIDGSVARRIDDLRQTLHKRA